MVRVLMLCTEQQLAILLAAINRPNLAALV
jgi:hypothetical protein